MQLFVSPRSLPSLLFSKDKILTPSTLQKLQISMYVVKRFLPIHNLFDHSPPNRSQGYRQSFAITRKAARDQRMQMSSCKCVSISSG